MDYDDIRQLRVHSKARTPAVDVAKAMKRAEAAVRQAADPPELVSVIAVEACHHDWLSKAAGPLARLFIHSASQPTTSRWATSVGAEWRSRSEMRRSLSQRRASPVHARWPLHPVRTRKHRVSATVYAPGFVYIAGSPSTRFLKIGITDDVLQRTETLAYERGYGGADDWEKLFHIKVGQKGRLEHDALALLSAHRVSRPYLKNGKQQAATELLQAPFERVFGAIVTALGSEPLEDKYLSPRWEAYAEAAHDQNPYHPGARPRRLGRHASDRTETCSSYERATGTVGTECRRPVLVLSPMA